MSSAFICSVEHDTVTTRRKGRGLDSYDCPELYKERAVERKSVSRCSMEVTHAEDKDDHLLDVCARLQGVYDRVNDCFFTTFSLNRCESLTFDVDEYRKRSTHLLSYLPTFEEMQGMNQIAGLWSDLFQTEVSMLQNHLLLERNIGISERMKHYLLTRERTSAFPRQKLVMSQALVKLQASIFSNDRITETTAESCVVSALNLLVTFNERINLQCAEDRDYYEQMRDELDTIKEHELLNRLPSVGKDRSKVLPFLRRLSQTFDTDKCTLNLGMMFFDFYVHTLLSRGSIDSPMDHNQALRISTACYLLACALREHWADISVDSYLDRAAQMVSGVFTSQDIVATQLDILQTMPKGFTSMYTVFEYGLFYLANIRGTYKPRNVGHGTTIASARSSDGTSTYGSDHVTSRTPVSQEQNIMSRYSQSPGSASVEHCGSQGPNSGGFVRRSPNNGMNNNLGRTSTIPTDEFGSRHSNYECQSESVKDLCDYLLLEMAFKYMVENGGYAFIYHSLIRWDDSYVSYNWNVFIPASRAAAVLVFHMFVEFFAIDPSKDLIWCRRFCYKVFHMLYDSDVALWYKMYRENIIKWIDRVSRSSTRMGEMALLLEVSGQKFRAAETFIQTFWSRIIFEYVKQGYDIEGIDQAQLKNELGAVYQLISQE